jgi:hypothetical protein
VSPWTRIDCGLNSSALPLRAVRDHVALRQQAAHALEECSLVVNHRARQLARHQQAMLADDTTSSSASSSPCAKGRPD